MKKYVWSLVTPLLLLECKGTRFLLLRWTMDDLCKKILVPLLEITYRPKEGIDEFLQKQKRTESVKFNRDGPWTDWKNDPYTDPRWDYLSEGDRGRPEVGRDESGANSPRQKVESLREQRLPFRRHVASRSKDFLPLLESSFEGPVIHRACHICPSHSHSQSDSSEILTRGTYVVELRIVKTQGKYKVKG